MPKTKTTFKKGQGGRKPGAVNKTTKTLREFISDFLNDNRDTLVKDFKRLSPRDRLTLFEKLLQYSIPKMQSTALSFDDMTDEQLDKLLDKLK